MNASLGWTEWWSTVTPEMSFLTALPLVVAIVALVADAEVQLVDETDHDGEHTLPRESVLRDVLVRTGTELRQLARESHDLLVLAGRPLREELGLVPILQPAHLIDADRLDGAPA